MEAYVTAGAGRTFPNAVRLGTRTDDEAEQSRLARSILGDHLLALVRGDAVDDVGELIAGLARDATAVVTTTWVVAYFSPEQRTGFREALAAASQARPVAWISAEGNGVVDMIPSDAVPTDEHGVEWSVLGLVTFQEGRADPELLGYVHPHGSGLDWRAGST